ncbi:MAG TPA: cyanophycin synthetase, partial [Chloroflexia bacterium]|nr:cyanophycin synthetase [Chloroflexia bacterium]
LRTFQTDEKTAPGRFNVFNVGGASVIVDYGHNPHALKAVQAAIQQMRPRRSIGVVAAPGDRRDADIQELAVVAANTFDAVIVREDEDLRGRERGEVAHLISETITRTRPSLPLMIIENEEESVSQALEMARSGDLVVVFVDKVDETIDQIKQASLAVARDKSDAMWCPIPDSASTASRVQAASDLVARNALDLMLDDESAETVMQGVSSPRSRNGGAGKRTNNERSLLHSLQDGEPDGHS